MGTQDELIDHWLTRTPRTPLVGAYCNVLLLAHWSVRQKLNHVSLAQFRYVVLYAP